jgi:hypothetical protein
MNSNGKTPTTDRLRLTLWITAAALILGAVLITAVAAYLPKAQAHWSGSVAYEQPAQPKEQEERTPLDSWSGSVNYEAPATPITEDEFTIVLEAAPQQYFVKCKGVDSDCIAAGGLPFEVNCAKQTPPSPAAKLDGFVVFNDANNRPINVACIWS